MRSKHVVVLLGGWNSEKDVSISSGEEVYKSLKELDYKVTKLFFDRDVVSKLLELKPDVVFNSLHGKFGEDGRIQGLLDILKIPYTHSGALSSAICMDKVIFRKICKFHDILVPEFDILRKGHDFTNKNIIRDIGKPFVIKPFSEGSSVGVEVILDDMEFDIGKYDWKYGDEIIIERYIKGKEINVAVVDDEAVGVIQVIAKNSLFYDYESKYSEGMTDYIDPNISNKAKDRIMDLALKCHKVMGCKDISRVEFLLDDYDNKIYLLEINTHPGITPLSLVPKIAKKQGISFDSIIKLLVENASSNST